MPVDDKGRWIATGNAEDASVANRRFQNLNGGRLAWEIVIDGDGEYYVGPFGPHGFAVQFGSQDPANPFTGGYSALLAESLRPGENAPGERGGRLGSMQPPALGGDFVNEVSPDPSGITRFAHAASRLRIIITGYVTGDGTLVAWVL